MDYKHYKQRPESLTAEFIQAEFDILFSKIEELSLIHISEPTRPY